ncbi:DUF1097 domain-containing protein [Petroclostridium sp. X23]|uniref:DUF1097 domain-containing protein n=1 Tax=Petroclostridium sp. X23 TaxID=3045146 RepID=UPI0024AD6165|nr:DUF1097 domain-containing protein [Petroclostridium sp. X23]WHH57041.1 DUF1097 domain-containing protein [Petroclostridium sp. X23]
MKLLTALGISVGILAGLWTTASISYGLVAWIGFLSWATFYAVGGKMAGVKYTLVTNITGVLWGYAILQIGNLVSASLGQAVGLGVAVAVIVFIMVLLGNFSLYQFIPGQFIGCASYFGSNFDLKATLIALVCGAILGYISEKIGILMAKQEPVQESTESAL